MFSFAHVKDSESGNSILEIWNPGLWNPVYSSRNPESSTWNLECTALNPESNTVLDSLTWGDSVGVVGSITPCVLCCSRWRRVYIPQNCIYSSFSKLTIRRITMY